MFEKVKYGVQSVRSALRACREIASCSQAALEQQKYISIGAVEKFYSNLGLPPDKIPHCRFVIKKMLMDLHEKDIVCSAISDEGCIFHDVVHDTRLLVPFVGFGEYVYLYWDVRLQAYKLNIDKPFVAIDIGSNLFYTAIGFALNSLCRKVYCYEIIPSIYQIGERNLELNPRLKGKIAGFNHGLYNKTGEVDVTYYPLRAGASGITEKIREWDVIAETTDSDFLLPKNRKEFSAPVKEAYPLIKAISDEFPEEELVVKVDAENSESEILENLLPLFDRVYCFFVEIHTEKASDRVLSLFKDRNFSREDGMVMTFYNRDRGGRPKKG